MLKKNEYTRILYHRLDGHRVRFTIREHYPAGVSIVLDDLCRLTGISLPTQTNRLAFLKKEAAEFFPSFRIGSEDHTLVPCCLAALFCEKFDASAVEKFRVLSIELSRRAVLAEKNLSTRSAMRL